MGRCITKYDENGLKIPNITIGKQCEHGTIKQNCIECGGCNRCIHNAIKHQCLICKPDNFCIHNRHKRNGCSDCRCLLKNPLYIDNRINLFNDTNDSYSFLTDEEREKIKNFLTDEEREKIKNLLKNKDSLTFENNLIPKTILKTVIPNHKNTNS
jgi:hypothetical protein